jgi:SAM-dependent methyltransferase
LGRALPHEVLLSILVPVRAAEGMAIGSSGAPPTAQEEKEGSAPVLSPGVRSTFKPNPLESLAAVRMTRAERKSRWALEYLKQAPLALCIRELNRLVALDTLVDLQGLGRHDRVLDVGCGDAFWWTLLVANREKVFGIDISEREVRQAASRIHAIRGDISRTVPFAGERFSELIGNCSLEHVRDINSALRNMHACAAERARLVLFVPTPSWAFQGRVQTFLLRRLPRLAMTVAGAMNGFFQHWHLYDSAVWASLLERNGWRVKEIHGLGNARSEFLFRLFLPLSLPAFVFKVLVGVYPNRGFQFLPDWALGPLQRLILWALRDPLVEGTHPAAYEYALIAEAIPRE